MLLSKSTTSFSRCLNRKTAVIAFAILSAAGCRTDPDVDNIFDPLAAGGSCVEGFQHSSKVQSLIVKNETMKLLKMVEIVSNIDGKATFDEKGERSIEIAPTQSHTIHFVVDSFQNGGSMLYQAQPDGTKHISYDPICAESSQYPLFLYHSEGIHAWLGLKLEDGKSVTLDIGLSDEWAEDKADSSSHVFKVTDETFKPDDTSDLPEPSFTVKPNN